MTHLSPSRLFRATKCFALAAILLVVAGTFFRYGFIIYRSLQQQAAAEHAHLVHSRGASPSMSADFEVNEDSQLQQQGAQQSLSFSPESPRVFAVASDGVQGGASATSASDDGRRGPNPLVAKILRVMMLGALGILLSIGCLCVIASSVLMGRNVDRSCATSYALVLSFLSLRLSCCMFCRGR